MDDLLLGETKEVIEEVFDVQHVFPTFPEEVTDDKKTADPWWQRLANFLRSCFGFRRRHLEEVRDQ
jgi:hypothetical protein